MKTVKFDLGNSCLLKFHNKNIRASWILPHNLKKVDPIFIVFQVLFLVREHFVLKPLYMKFYECLK